MAVGVGHAVGPDGGPIDGEPPGLQVLDRPGDGRVLDRAG